MRLGACRPGTYTTQHKTTNKTRVARSGVSTFKHEMRLGACRPDTYTDNTKQQTRHTHTCSDWMKIATTLHDVHPPLGRIRQNCMKFCRKLQQTPVCGGQFQDRQTGVRYRRTQYVANTVEGDRYTWNGYHWRTDHVAQECAKLIFRQTPNEPTQVSPGCFLAVCGSGWLLQQHQNSASRDRHRAAYSMELLHRQCAPKSPVPSRNACIHGLYGCRWLQ